MRKHLSTIILVIVLILGVMILLYPTVSDYWNSFHQSRAIASYLEEIENIDPVNYEREWARAEQYNEALLSKPNRFVLSDEDYAEYETLLNLTGSGIMGYIEIPKINCSLPVYHGTDEAVLQIAVGHIEGTSLPTGGPGTHTVLSGHRGLPSARLFTDLDQMEEGDLFVIRVMDRVMTYMVDQVLIVLPEEMDGLAIDPDEDYCTLVTCTPYGINSHRLLVRGRRTDNVEMEQIIKVVSDATQIKPILVAPVLAAPMLLVLLVWMMISTGRKQRRRKIIK
ncbi:MAG: class C sortase [Oscillospiraceae bacterium]|nr:class C sortase [Oscillospiraceae bacterium]